MVRAMVKTSKVSLYDQTRYVIAWTPHPAERKKARGRHGFADGARLGA